MSEQKPKSDNKIVMLAAAAVVIIIIGALIYDANKKDQQTISMSIGGKTISATVEQ